MAKPGDPGSFQIAEAVALKPASICSMAGTEILPGSCRRLLWLQSQGWHCLSPGHGCAFQCSVQLCDFLLCQQCGGCS